MAILFKSIAELSKFKRDSGCRDFYVDRDLLSIVGIFTEFNLNLAINKYNAIISMDRHTYQ